MKRMVLLLLMLSGIAFISSTVYRQYAVTGPDDTIHVGVVPSSLPFIDGNWEKLAFEALNRKTTYNNNYGFYIIYAANKQYQQQFIQIFKSESLSGDFYDWLIPSIVAKWNRLSIFEKVYVKDLLSHMKGYLNNYSPDTENEYLTMNPKKFTKCSPNDFWDAEKQKPYPTEMLQEWRYFEAFMYRRAMEGISANTLKKYFELLLNDLSLDPEINYKNAIDGELLERFSIAEGKKEGEWIFNQQIQFEGKKTIVPKELQSYKSGKKEGEWKKYIVIGNEAYVSVIKQYKNDELTDLEVYTYANNKPGVLQEVVKYDIKAREMVTETYENGKVKETKKEKL